MIHRVALGLCIALLACSPDDGAVGKAAADQAWRRHAIAADPHREEPDGVRLSDVDRDGDQDAVVAWEVGGFSQIYRNPGPERAKDPWPGVRVGPAPEAEEAFAMHVDGDGAMDVVSLGEDGQLSIHWAPLGEDAYWRDDAWRTVRVTAPPDAPRGKNAVALDLNRDGQSDIVVAGVGGIGWYEVSRSDPRAIGDWVYRRLGPMGYARTLQVVDMDSDGDEDLFVTDRIGKLRGARWLENQGQLADWRSAFLHEAAAPEPGREDVQFMFGQLVDFDGDGRLDAVVSSGRERWWGVGHIWENWVDYLQAVPPPGRGFRHERIRWRSEHFEGQLKAVRAADLNLDGTMDLFLLYRLSAPPRRGAAWLERTPEGRWVKHDVSSPQGIKFDDVTFYDVDGDGDLDVLTTEEYGGLGVIWFENPTR
jgi:VCBS repeat protein